MAFVGYEQVAVSNSVLTVTSLTIPANAQRATLQAETQAVRYTMDGTAPTTSTGMLLLTTEPPKDFAIDDIRNIRLIRNGGSDGVLNVHYSAGRDV